MNSCSNCEVMATLMDLMEANKKMEKVYLQAGRAEVKLELLQAAENGTPVNLNGRAWFLKSDIQNLRDIFEDLKSEAKEEPAMCGFGVLKQLLFDCATNLILTDKPRKEVADDILKHITELDKFKVVEVVEEELCNECLEDMKDITTEKEKYII